MREIYLNGPVLACIFDYDYYNDFYNKYPLGIFNSTEGSDATGGHCLNLIGWGVDRESGMKYWYGRSYFSRTKCFLKVEMIDLILGFC